MKIKWWFHTIHTQVNIILFIFIFTNNILAYRNILILISIIFLNSSGHLNKLSFIILIIYQSGITKKINSFPLLSITRLKNDCPNISSSEFISQSSIHVAHPSCSWIVTKPRCKIYRRSFIFPIGFSNVRQKRFRNEMRNFRRFNGR